MSAVSGLVDLQVNGFGGIDLMRVSADGWTAAGEAMLATGVTAYRPTVITADEDEMAGALASIAGAWTRPRILGAHLEGPFLSPARLGAHRVAAEQYRIALREKAMGAVG